MAWLGGRSACRCRRDSGWRSAETTDVCVGADRFANPWLNEAAAQPFARYESAARLRQAKSA